MNRLQAELRRLYRLGSLEDEGNRSEDFGLISPDGGVRAMVLELARPADWTVLSTLWQGVQVDLELPAPAIAVSGIDGYQLWFSLSDPVPVVEARSFLESLRLRYLGNIAPGRVAMRPSVEASVSGPGQHAKMVPALWAETGRWSAFIAPDLAAVFSDEPWLDICPSPDAQADILSRMVSIKAEDFQMVLGRLSAEAKTAPSHMALAANERGGSKSDLDPKRFLLDVMGDKTIELHLRIQAAQALLPYFESRPRSVT
ncbi:hypothetical protein [Rhodoferax sp.]|uniref:hypothetical protein n=1 Tax=Rhodoferax sp. TaxID=50421 RepID=UPI0025D1928D|nr:hypothetical protein [Rhodoferax sp.]